MKKIVVIGDVHGRTAWTQIKNMTFDEAIFVGDYLDSFDISPIDQLKNCEDIIQFKNDNPDKVTLLLGNHDACYVWTDLMYRGSGFNSAMIYDFGNLINKNICNGNIQIAYLYNNYLITHAGLVNRFHSHFLDNCDISEIPNKLMDLTLTRDGRDALFTMGYSRGGHNIDSPIWCHDRELMLDYIPGINQIVGHTYQVDGDVKITTKSGNMLWFVDAYPHIFTYEI